MKKALLLILFISITLWGCKKEGKPHTYKLRVQSSAPSGKEIFLRVGDGKPARTIYTSQYTEEVTYIIGNTTNVSAQFVPFLSKSISLYISKDGTSVVTATGVGSASISFIPSK